MAALERLRRSGPFLLLAGLLVLAGAVGFGIGYLDREKDPGPELTRGEAFVQARERTVREVAREMARRGFDDGRRSGRSHGIIAGGMAAESAATITFREQRASQAQETAASAQSELAAIASGSAPAVPSPGDD